MGPAYYLIAILGCGEGEAPCRQVSLMETRYESQAACTAQTEAALARSTDVDFPVVVAQCIAAGAPPVRVTPGEVRLQPAGGQAPSAPVETRRS
jgi:hypothetical protein